MGACGCIDNTEKLRFKGPKGITYVLEISQPCEDCEGPLGVILRQLDREAVEDEGADGYPEVEFRDFGECPEAAFPILFPEKLIRRLVPTGRAIAEMALDSGLQPLTDDEIADAIRDEFYCELEDAINESRAEGCANPEVR